LSPSPAPGVCAVQADLSDLKTSCQQRGGPIVAVFLTGLRAGRIGQVPGRRQGGLFYGYLFTDKPDI